MSEFKRVIRDGEICNIKTLPNGAEVHRNGKHDYRAAIWAEFMASNGYPKTLTGDAQAPELSLFTLWNDAIENGCRDPGAKETKEDYKIELLDESDFWDRYAHKDCPAVLAMRFAENPLRLE